MTKLRTPKPGEALSERERRVLVCLANGMQKQAVARVLLLSYDQVSYSSKMAQRKLDATGRTPALAVARAIRSGLISHDEIEGGPSSFTQEQGREALLGYASMLRSPPKESWPELRERCRRIAVEFRAHRAAVADEVGRVEERDRVMLEDQAA